MLMVLASLRIFMGKIFAPLFYFKSRNGQEDWTGFSISNDMITKGYLGTAQAE